MMVISFAIITITLLILLSIVMIIIIDKSYDHFSSHYQSSYVVLTSVFSITIFDYSLIS
jgi:hypothetical protein